VKKVIKRLIFISAFLVLSAQAQEQAEVSSAVSKDTESFEEFDTARDEFSDKYMAGPHLIYDCEDKHWVCVDDRVKKDCLEGREKRELDKFRSLKCTFVKTLEDKPSCFKHQLSMINSANDPEWSCTVDKWRAKNIKFE
jgi:hypothetical protein